MGEVIQFRRDAREQKNPGADWEFIGGEIAVAGERLALPDPEADLAALPLAPLPPVDAVAARRRDIEAALTPAGVDGAGRVVRALAKTIKIPGETVIGDWVEFSAAMIGALSGYSTDVLKAAGREALRTQEWFPSTAWMISTCDELARRRRDELHAINNIETERDRRRREEEDRQRHIAEERSWFLDLQSRMALAGEPPSLADVELAAGIQRGLHHGGGIPLTWTQFADQDPSAAAELCQRLARIARAGLDPAEHAQAIAEALDAAGFRASPPRVHRLRPLEPDPAPPRLSEILATLNIGGIGAPPQGGQTARSDAGKAN
jgi:hypothetical protein